MLPGATSGVATGYGMDPLRCIKTYIHSNPAFLSLFNRISRIRLTYQPSAALYPHHTLSSHLASPHALPSIPTRSEVDTPLTHPIPSSQLQITLPIPPTPQPPTHDPHPHRRLHLPPLRLLLRHLHHRPPRHHRQRYHARTHRCQQLPRLRRSVRSKTMAGWMAYRPI